MTHLNFSVEQRGCIYISLSGNASTFFSSYNNEKIQKGLVQIHDTLRQRYATHLLETNWRRVILSKTVLIVTEVTGTVWMLQPLEPVRANLLYLKVGRALSGMMLKFSI